MSGSADSSSTGHGADTHCTSCGAPFLPQRVGQEVAAICFPAGDPMTLTRETVSELNRTSSAKYEQACG